MKRYMKIEDLYELKMVSEPAVAPGGAWACVVTGLSEKKQLYVSSIVLPDRTISVGDRSISPAFSPDGGYLAFLSDTDGMLQLYTAELPDGAPVRQTTMRWGVASFLWSRDGRKIYFTAEDDPTVPPALKCCEQTDAEKRQAEADAKDHPRIIRNIVHKWDGQGYLTGRKTQVWSLSLDTGAVTQLTDMDANCREMALSPSGDYLAFVSDPIEENDYRPQDVNLWLLETATGTVRRLINDAVFVSFPAFLSEHEILFSGHEAEYGWGTISRLYLYDLKQESWRCISRETDLSAANTALGDFQQSSWCFGVDTVNACAYFTASHFGSTELFRTDREGRIEPVLTGEFVIQGAAYTSDGTRAVAVISDPVTPGRLEQVNLKTGERCLLADPNRTFFENVTVSVPERVKVTTFDGLPIDGWVLKPPAFSPGQRYPAIIEIHGGPQCMYACNFMHEFQMLAAQGYVVGYFNPRGSSGYGQRFKSLIRREYGGVGTGDFMDIMAGADFVAALPYVDEARMGVTGGSYGGFMTNWTVSHTDRFRAAVTQRSISNWASFLGSSDYGFCDAELAHQCDYFDEPFELRRISPISYVKRIHTPLLILHSEYDYRCPLEQAEQLFIALKLLRRTTELRIFPGQSHGLSRGGRPALRAERLRAILGWFDTYLKD